MNPSRNGGFEASNPFKKHMNASDVMLFGSPTMVTSRSPIIFQVPLGNPHFRAMPATTDRAGLLGSLAGSGLAQADTNKPRQSK
jgi:hypothetical protein